MPLFQKSVLNKYLAAQDINILEEKYSQFKAYFLNPTVQNNIKESKEEEFQEGFLRELFVKIFGYVINPYPDFNLITELKNEKDSKKADGAIIDKGTVFAVIELKSTATSDLNKIEIQAFNYKNNQKDCKYVITSNFQKIRFYIDDAIDFIEWDLFKLDFEQFKILFLCLNKEHILHHLPFTIKVESLIEEENITKKLYNEYSGFRKSLFNNIVELNPSIDKLILFKKTQKLLDRFLFLFFAEDRNLIPPNYVRIILTQWTELKEKFDEHQHLYDRFKKNFGYLNTGYSGKTNEIFAYNGGLFAPDEILDTIVVSDEILYNGTLSLSRYDYNSEVDVNILGHIFEHSLTEIEELENVIINGETSNNNTSKRKKDGVFYTPKFITKYIVENSLGVLIRNKKEEIGINDEEYVRGGRNIKTQRPLLVKLYKFRDWLLNITIIDPACGSGAFLTQALDYLIYEHRHIAYLESILTKRTHADESIMLLEYGVESHILENNLFGVDINDESVDIAKLSLWLRTAMKGRKLSSLNNNIKCGNSLIEDKNIAGDKAFNWQKEFPSVFEKGGFDVVLGNPPYVRVQGLKENNLAHTHFYEQNYNAATGNYDIYVLFIEKGFSLANESGIVSYILPHKFLVSEFGVGIRKYLSQNRAVEKLIHFGSELIFSEASTYTCIICLTKRPKENLHFKKISAKELSNSLLLDFMSYQNLTENNWDLQNEQVLEIINKLKKQPYTIEDIFDKIFVGLQTSLDEIYVFEGEIKGDLVKGFCKKYNYSFEIEKDLVKPFIKGNEISRYKTPKIKNFVLFPYWVNNNNIEPVSEEYIKDSLPKTYSFLNHFSEKIKNRENGKMNIEKYWYLYIYPKNLAKFQYPKIMTQEISLGCNMTYDEDGIFYHPTTIYSFIKKTKPIINDKYYLGILNSKVMWFFLKNTGTELRGGYFRFKTNYLKPFPLPLISKNSQEIIDGVDYLLKLNRQLDNLSNYFINFLIAKFPQLKISSKIEEWYLLDFTTFLSELKKQQIKLSLQQESEWMKYFEDEKQKALVIKEQIIVSDKKMDEIVYDLYGLTMDEIRFIESNI